MDCSGLLATGHTSGCIYFWRDRVVVSVLQVCDADPKVRVESKGCPSFVIESSVGIRCIRLWSMDASQQPASMHHKHKATSNEGHCWCLAAASQEGAVHIYGITACGSTILERSKTSNSIQSMPKARRIVSLWLPRHMGGATRSAVRTFDIKQSPRGLLNAVIGAYDGTIWICCLNLESRWQVRGPLDCSVQHCFSFQSLCVALVPLLSYHCLAPETSEIFIMNILRVQVCASDAHMNFTWM